MDSQCGLLLSDKQAQTDPELYTRNSLLTHESKHASIRKEIMTHTDSCKKLHKLPIIALWNIEIRVVIFTASGWVILMV